MVVQSMLRTEESLWRSACIRTECHVRSCYRSRLECPGGIREHFEECDTPSNFLMHQADMQPTETCQLLACLYIIDPIIRYSCIAYIPSACFITRVSISS